MDKEKIKSILNDLWDFIRKYAPWLIISVTIIETIVGYKNAFHFAQKITIAIDIIIITSAIFYAYHRKQKEYRLSYISLMVSILWLYFKTMWSIAFLW